MEKIRTGVFGQLFRIKSGRYGNAEKCGKYICILDSRFFPHLEYGKNADGSIWTPFPDKIRKSGTNCGNTDEIWKCGIDMEICNMNTGKIWKYGKIRKSELDIEKTEKKLNKIAVLWEISNIYM